MKAKDCRLWEQQKEKGYEDDYEETTGALAMAHENCMLAKLSASFSVLSSHLTSTNSRIDFSLGRMEWNGMAFQNPAMIDACKTWEVEKRHMQDAGMYRWRGVKRRTSLDSRRQTRKYRAILLTNDLIHVANVSSGHQQFKLREFRSQKAPMSREENTRSVRQKRSRWRGCVVGWQLCVGFLVPIDGCEGRWIAKWSGKSFWEGEELIKFGRAFLKRVII